MSTIQLEKNEYYDLIYRAAKNNDKKTFRKLFLSLHDRDQNEVFDLLYPEKKQKIADFLSPDEFSNLFKWMDIEDQEYIVEHFPETFIRELFDAISADDIVRFFKQSDRVTHDELTGLLSEQRYVQVEMLLNYPMETAGAIMTKEFIYAHPEQTASELLEYIRQNGDQAETIYYIYVLDDQDRLTGVLSLRDLIMSPLEENLENIMFSRVVAVKESDDQEEVARVLQDYDLVAVPVVDQMNEMIGIITFDDIMDVVQLEMTEDFKEFAAIRKSEESTSTKGILSTARNRIPWIIILIFLGLLVGSLIGFFEETLESVVLLAAFIPMIMDTAGNVGTQALAVAVRNLNVDDDDDSFLETLKVEFGAGILIGLAAAAALTLLILIFYQNIALAFVVSISVLVTVSFSTVVGAVIPFIANKLNFDPAVASGPFITTINDALGLLIYFSIATALLHLI